MKKIYSILPGSILLLVSLASGAASAAKAIPLPESREAFLYSALSYPFKAQSPSDAKPVGIGPLAEGGDSFGLRVSIGPFAAPVDMYLTLLTPDEERGTVLSLQQDNTFKAFSGSTKPWREKVTSADEFIMDIPISSMASGPYVLMFAVMPVDAMDRYYLWTVPFLIP